MMAAKQFAYPKLTQDQLALNNILCTTMPEFSSKFGSQPCIITLHPDMHRVQYDLQVTLTCEGIVSNIFLPKTLFETVNVGQTSLSTVIASLPEDLLAAVVNMTIEPLLRDFRSLLQKDVQCSAVQYLTQQPAKNASGALLIFKTNDVDYKGFMSAGTEISQWFNNLPAARTDLSNSHICRVNLEIGSTVIGEQSLRRMKTSDIILVQRNYYIDNSKIIIRLSERIHCVASVEDDQIIITSPLEKNVMNDDLDSIESPQTAANSSGSNISSDDIDSIPVKLSFDVGHLELTLGDIRKLQPGFTFQLNRPVASPVLIRANGKPFAEAELVEINQQLGARITRLV